MLFNFALLLLFCHACNSEDPSIVIIGAGPSGIAAATKLIKNGLTNIKILEAENRIGGRINSVKFGDAYVDLGAEWCHGGGDDTIVYKLAKKYDILKRADFNTTTVAYSEGQLEKDVHDDMVNLLQRFLESNDPYNTSLRNTSAKDYYLKLYNPILEKYKDNPKKLKQATEAIDYAKTTFESYMGAFDWNDISAYSNYLQPSVKIDYHWNGLGYHTILNILMEKYPDPKNGLPIDDKFVLSKEVKTIHWNNENKKVKIECTDGSNFETDHVIFTPSIGVLKHQHENLFNPKLDEGKIEAISKIGFGAAIKILLHFNTPWWKPDETGLFWMYSDEDKQKFLKEFPNAPQMYNESWLNDFQFMMPAENNPNVLVCWILGPTVPEVEIMKDEDMIKGIMFAIRKVFGNQYNITDPDSMIHSKWWNNPHFHGTWSYETVEGNRDGTKDFHAILAKPLEKNGKMVVQFAGEATHSTKFSTVHGAIETGFREADRILKLYNKNAV